jgi:hypothetical protein
MNNLEIEEPELQDKWDYTGDKEAEWEETKRLRIRSGNTLDESLPKQEPRWIPFSERLPEHGQWYARMYVYPNGEKELQTSAQFWHQDGQWAFNSYDGYRGRTFVIESLPPQIYWYPLPKEQDLLPWELRKGNEHITPEQQ